MKLSKKQFVTEFGDNISEKLGFAYDALMLTLSPYGSVVDMAITDDVPYKHESVIMVDSWTSLDCSPGDTQGEYSGCGYILWSTTSGHRVKFMFEVCEAPNESPWFELVKVIIGTESKCFYPGIKKACEKNKIPLQEEADEKQCPGGWRKLLRRFQNEIISKRN